MAAFWLVNEMMANNDSICYSRYAHKDRGGLLTFGPVWDFDVATASMKISNITNPVVWTACQWNSRQNLFREWADDPFFCLKLFEKYWSDVRPWMMDLLNDGRYDDCIDYSGKLEWRTTSGGIARTSMGLLRICSIRGVLRANLVTRQ